MMGRTRTTKHRLRSPVWPGLGSLLTLIVLLFGVPTALVFFGGSPANIRGATPGAIWTAISSPDSGQVFVIAVVIVGWLAWASFAVATVVECVNWIGNSSGRRVPLLGAQQRLAAGLIAAIVMMTGAPAMASATAAPARAAAVAAPYVHTEHTEHPPAPVDNTPAVSTAIHHVARGETLLDVAEQYGVPSDVIAAANVGRIQPDGGALATGQSRLYPGWQLQIPTDATTSTMASAALAPDQVDADTYVVKHGDYLGDIAERTLGEFDDYRQIAALNPTLIPERSGPHGPDHIEPGWKLQLPPAATDHGPQTHATGHVTSRPGPPPAAVSPAPATPPTHLNSPAPSPSVSAQPDTASASPPATAPPAAAAGPTGTQSLPSSPPSAPTSGQPSSSFAPSSAAAPTPSTAPTPAVPGAATHADRSVAGDAPEASSRVTTTALAGAGLLAALLISGLVARRRRQQPHRRADRRLPHPAGGATERVLQVASQPADVERLEAAMRTLAAGLAGRDHDRLPDVLGAWIDDGEIRLILATPCSDPPAPWIAAAGYWSLPANAAPDDGDVGAPPLPALTAVGSERGRHLLLDLERLGNLTILGTRDRRMALLRYVASELACNTWSDDVNVTIAGFDPDEAALLVELKPGRMRAAASISEAVSRLRQAAAVSATALRDVGAVDAFAGRINDLAADAWMPQILLVADPSAAESAALAELASDLRAAGRCAIAIAAANTDVLVGGGHAIAIDDDGSLAIISPELRSTIGTMQPVAAAGLPMEEVQRIAHIMARARALDDEPVPPAAETERWATGTDAAGALLDDDTVVVEDIDRLNTYATAASEAVAESVGAVRAAIPARSDSVPTRVVSAAVRQRRDIADPGLTADLQAWLDRDATRPRIGILGPVTLEAGEAPEERRRAIAEVIVYLAQRGARGVDPAAMEDALWAGTPVKPGRLRVEISRARSWLGETPAGLPWLPMQDSDHMYRLADGYLLDWHLFRRLRSRGEAHGAAGVRDLRAALELVRGAPLAGGERAYRTRNRLPYTWLPDSDIYPLHISAAIADTARQLAELYMAAGDTVAARWAVHQGWRGDPDRGDDALWRLLMHAEAADGRDGELRVLLNDLMDAREAEVPEDLTAYPWLCDLLPELRGSAAMPVEARPTSMTAR